MKSIYFLPLFLALNACGYKGNLYLPKPNDDAKFGVIQTGIDFKRPSSNKAASEPAISSESTK